MRLNDALVTSFVYEGSEYDINLAFDNVLDVFDVLVDETLRGYEMADICLALLLREQEYEPTVEMWNYVYEKFIHFESKRPIEYDLNGDPMPVQEDDEEESYSNIEQDAEYIYASFRQAYGINLFREQGKMQWSEFKALLHGLPQNTTYKQIMQVRAWKPTEHDSEETKENMKKLQRHYALSEEVEE